MRLNKSTNHAIRILIECARSDGELTKVAQLSQRLDITQQNTFKIVHLLSRAGYLEAQRGRYGGVKLARPASDIKVGQVVRAMELGALAQGDTSKAGNPGLNRIIDDALNAFIEVLDQNTLHDMVQKKTHQKNTGQDNNQTQNRTSKINAPLTLKNWENPQEPKTVIKTLRLHERRQPKLISCRATWLLRLSSFEAFQEIF